MSFKRLLIRLQVRMVTVNFHLGKAKNPVGIYLFFTGMTPFPVYMVIPYSVLFFFFER